MCRLGRAPSRLSSVGQSNALVMRRSRVRIPKAALPATPAQMVSELGLCVSRTLCGRRGRGRAGVGGLSSGLRRGACRRLPRTSVTRLTAESHSARATWEGCTRSTSRPGGCPAGPGWRSRGLPRGSTAGGSAGPASGGQSRGGARGGDGHHCGGGAESAGYDGADTLAGVLDDRRQKLTARVLAMLDAATHPSQCLGLLQQGGALAACGR